MPNLIARFAEQAFWLGRYVERAESLARLIEINETYARDQTGVSDWKRILELFSDVGRYQESYDDFDEGSILTFYILDRDNPTSIASAIHAGRENARALRHLISTEMWTHINIIHNQHQALKKRDIDANKVSRLCLKITMDCQAFEGIAEGTFFRGETWTFYQLGKYVERADQTTRILDMGYHRLVLDRGDAVGSIYWNALLRSVSGYHAFRQQHPIGSAPEDIAKFLLYDEEFPRAVALCVNQMTARIRDLERRHGVKRRTAVEQARRELEFMLETGLEIKLTSARLHKFLDQIQVALAKLSGALNETYFYH